LKKIKNDEHQSNHTVSGKFVYMKKLSACILFTVLFSMSSNAQQVPSPEQYLGYPLGSHGIRQWLNHLSYRRYPVQKFLGGWKTDVLQCRIFCWTIDNDLTPVFPVSVLTGN
jgi:hypothetical protein